MYYVTEEEEAIQACKYLNQKSILAIDTETTGLDPLSDKVLLLQIGDKQEQFVFDIYQLGKSIAPVLDVLAQEDVLKILHNAKFDYQFIKTNFDVSMTRMRCTMLAEQLLIQGWRNQFANLEAVMEKYMRHVKLDKLIREQFIDRPWGDTFTDKELIYAADDVKYLIELNGKLELQLMKRGLNMVADLECRTVPVTAEMELAGVLINSKKWVALKDDAQKKATEYKYQLDSYFKSHCNSDLFGQPVINYNSQLQIKPILEKIIGKPLNNTNKDYLKTINHDVIETLMNYRKAMKLVTTYGQAFLDNNVRKDTGRIHCRFKQLGADTGRYSSSGPNLQNIPKQQEYRTPFMAEPGYKIINVDYKSQELRLLAQISGEDKFIKAIEENKDLHCYSASLLYNIPYENFFDYDEEGNVILKADGDARVNVKMKPLRLAAKSITFGL